jgi:hypothetical protein
MKKIRNLEWQDYRHPEFLQSLIVSVNELKFIRLFLKRGSVAIVNEMLRERKSKQNSSHKEDFSNRSYQLKKIKA